MNPVRLGLFLFSVTALTLSQAWAQENKAPTPLRKMEPPPAIRKLLSYGGTFKGNGTLTMGGKKQSVKVTNENKVVAGGLGLLSTEKAVMEGGGEPYLAVNLFGFDRGTDSVHLYSVTNMAEAHDHAGRWSDDSTLEMEYRGKDPDTGGSMVETLVVVLSGPNSYSYTSRTAVDGKEVLVFEAALKK